VYTAAFVAEAMRAGIQAVSRGQAEAARSLGLSYGRMMRLVVLPQAVATVVPPLGNLAIAMTKNTSVTAAVTVPDVLYQTQVINAGTFATYPVFFMSAALYLLLTLPMGAAVGSLLFGTLLALARHSRKPALNYPATVYIELIRALPVLYLIFFAYFGGARFGLREPVVAATLALIVYTSAVNAEIVRAGIVSIERGQVEAARALGLSYWSMMRLVVLPQAFRRVMPPQVSQLVTLIKDTSLAYMVGTTELMRRVFILYSGFDTGVGVTQGLFVVSCIYFVLNFALSRFGHWLQLRGAGRSLAAAPAARSVAAAAHEGLAGFPRPST
jgi:putative glutamine transport system permease protein